jgi:hypothetical protein
VSGFQEPYARKFNSLIIASDSQICPDKIDSLKVNLQRDKLHFNAWCFNHSYAFLLSSYVALSCNLINTAQIYFVFSVEVVNDFSFILSHSNKGIKHSEDFDK